MPTSSTILTMAKTAPNLIYITASLSWMYITLGIRVRQARGACEKQLTLQGMSKEDAKMISASFEDLKNDLTGTIKQSIFARGR